jgi:hypothetical protein
MSQVDDAELLPDLQPVKRAVIAGDSAWKVQGKPATASVRDDELKADGRTLSTGCASGHAHVHTVQLPNTWHGAP